MIINDCVLDLENSMDLEPAATPWIDRSRYENNGTVTGATWAQLPSGLWVMSFDGINDIVSIPNHVSLNTVNGTWECWFNYTNVAANVRLIDKDTPGNADGDAWLQTVAAGTRLQFILDDGTGVGGIVDSDVVPALNDGEWHHIALPFGTGGMRMYIDTVLQADTDVYAGGTSPSLTNYAIGARQNSSAFWNGNIALPRFLSYELTPGQVRNRYEKTKHLLGVFD